MEKGTLSDFGKFVQMLRKEKNLTQKELADKLCISDKAVSKWERGLNLPDISLLIPLSKILGVTTTELLTCKKMESDEKIPIRDVENLVEKTLTLKAESEEIRSSQNIKRRKIFLFSVFIMLLEIMLLYFWDFDFLFLGVSLITIELLLVFFNGYFAFCAKDILPSFYDENKINFYSDGLFRMNVPGVHFNNSNWRYIVKYLNISLSVLADTVPIIYLLIFKFITWEYEKSVIFFVLLPVLLGIFVPIYYAGRKYQ